MDLIPTSVLTMARRLHERAMTSRCQVYERYETTDPRTGQTKLSPPRPRGLPVRCLVDRSGGLSPAETRIAERISEITYATIQLPVGVEIHGSDQIDATTTIGDTTSIERFDVIGEPGPGSYSTAISVPCKAR